MSRPHTGSRAHRPHHFPPPYSRRDPYRPRTSQDQRPLNNATRRRDSSLPSNWNFFSANDLIKEELCPPSQWCSHHLHVEDYRSLCAKVSEEHYRTCTSDDCLLRRKEVKVSTAFHVNENRYLSTEPLLSVPPAILHHELSIRGLNAQGDKLQLARRFLRAIAEEQTPLETYSFPTLDEINQEYMEFDCSTPFSPKHEPKDDDVDEKSSKNKGYIFGDQSSARLIADTVSDVLKNVRSTLNCVQSDRNSPASVASPQLPDLDHSADSAVVIDTVIASESNNNIRENDVSNEEIDLPPLLSVPQDEIEVHTVTTSLDNLNLISSGPDKDVLYLPSILSVPFYLMPKLQGIDKALERIEKTSNTLIVVSKEQHSRCAIIKVFGTDPDKIIAKDLIYKQIGYFPPPANQIQNTVPEDTVLAEIDPEWIDSNNQGDFDTVDDEIHNTVD